jgi:hypothetical protein
MRCDYFSLVGVFYPTLSSRGLSSFVFLWEYSLPCVHQEELLEKTGEEKHFFSNSDNSLHLS